MSTEELKTHGPQLAVHEWIAVIIILSIVSFITSITYLSPKAIPEEIDTPHYIVSPVVEITIEGAVQSPGIYRIKKGTPLLEAIHLASPLPEADLRRIDPEATVKRKRTIKIKKQK